MVWCGLRGAIHWIVPYRGDVSEASLETSTVMPMALLDQ